MTTLFQKRHYEWLADWCGCSELNARVFGEAKQHSQHTITLTLCHDLVGTNPQFNVGTFLSHVADIVTGTRIVRALGDSYKVRPAGLRRAV